MKINTDRQSFWSCLPQEPKRKSQTQSLRIRGRRAVPSAYDDELWELVPEDPGPPPTFEWLMRKLYTSAALSFMERIVSGIHTVYRRILR